MAKKSRKPSSKKPQTESPEALRHRIRELEQLATDLELENIALRYEISIRKPPKPPPKSELCDAFDEILSEWRSAFSRESVYRRARDLARAFLLNLGRRTITGAIVTMGRQYEEWSATYRIFSKARFHPDDLFEPLMKRCVEHTELPFFPIAIDDSQLPRKGKKIKQARILRDSHSLPFHHNLHWAVRFLQASALLSPEELHAQARGIPVAFRLAPSPKRPGRRAGPEAHEAYEMARKEHTLGRQAARLVHQQRDALDAIDGGEAMPLLACVDGAMANKAFLRNLPERTEFLARSREDAALWKPDDSGDRRRVYGERMPTPNELRGDEAVPWQEVEAYAAGEVHSFRVKELGPVLWKNITLRLPLRLIIIAPLGYRPSKNHRVLYRRPAYLLTSDLDTSLSTMIQMYVNRWEIEVNFRDEKTVLGLGQAQTWTPNSVELVPAFIAATYGALLLASLDAFGPTRTDDYLTVPKWRSCPPHRASVEDMIARTRQEVWGLWQDPPRSCSEGPRREPPHISKECQNALLGARR